MFVISNGVDTKYFSADTELNEKVGNFDATDAMLKAADVEFIGSDTIGAGRTTVIDTGEVGAVKAVSYTHLDVNKRQLLLHRRPHLRRSGSRERAFQHDLCGHLRFRCCLLYTS